MIKVRQKRIAGRRVLRPMVLGVAMLVPALLAGGLMVAEVSGYDLAVHGVAVDTQAWKGADDRRPPVVAAPGRREATELRAESRSESRAVPRAAAGTEPRLVPPPLRPYRIYNGWVPPDVVSVSYSRPEASPEEAAETGSTADRRRRKRPEPEKGEGREPSRETREPGTARPGRTAENDGQKAGGESSPTPSSTPSPAPSPEVTPGEAEELQDAECSQEWRKTWLWEVCMDGNRQKI
ncbi:hypothetical protein ACFOWE_21800 [Planomonospora corallina]|uniref:Uncharacterized protein n=1 Tax=Planomonospora corallina TaxID=1806052 RepID=A0ABV8IGK1_9ACTN